MNFVACLGSAIGLMEALPESPENVRNKTLTKKGQYDTAKLEILINTTKTTNIFMFYIKCYKNGCLSLIRDIFKVLYGK